MNPTAANSSEDGQAHHEQDEVSIDFCTLGMFIIDEIHFKPPIPPVKDVLGGAGSYSALGARIFSPPPSSRSVGWIVDCGSDFPPELRTTIAAWETSCLMRETPERLTTRGWNGYDEDEYRAFKYTTPKLRLDHTSLTPQLLASKSFHLICSPKRCIDIVTNILARLDKQHNSREAVKRPFFIWEPVPDLCTPEELQNCYEALKHIDVVSPNHQELAGFFGKKDEIATSGNLNRALVAELCAKWLDTGIGKERHGSVVVRCGASGCYIAVLDNATKGSDQQWIPAYHEDASKVVDPTGGGNTFLGGFAVGLVRTGDIREAAIWGSIAASFAIEQVGMPVLKQEEGLRRWDGREGKRELWNGVRLWDRLMEYKRRLER